MEVEPKCSEMIEASMTNESPVSEFLPDSEIEKVNFITSWSDLCLYWSLRCCLCCHFLLCEDCCELRELCYEGPKRRAEALNQNIESPPDILKESPEVQEKINRCTCGVMSCTCCSCCICCSKEGDHRDRPEYYAST